MSSCFPAVLSEAFGSSKLCKISYINCLLSFSFYSDVSDRVMLATESSDKRPWDICWFEFW